ncbi:MAG: hypothetical protein H0U95_03765 [Bacteroidetes bacterium]|nr:hypothetical protein [Bacteroidota bacterium]
MTIYEYARLSTEQKKAVLKNEAILLEHFAANGNTVYVYFLNNFFIEIVTKNGKIIDNIPFI